MGVRFWVVCYDIANPKRLRRVAKIMELVGDRVQKSVFECGLSTAAMAAHRQRLRTQIDHRHDRLLYLPIGVECRSRIVWQGRQPPTAVEPFWIV